ncbi:hypothetical protein MC885_009287 [Smutsia gigantea]|nr:hypothetical protein MC885_009287 [Smutsia gigantea]
MPLVAGEASHGPGWPGACNITVHVRQEQRPVQAPQAQTFILTQAPVRGSTPGALRGNAERRPGLLVAHRLTREHLQLHQHLRKVLTLAALQAPGVQAPAQSPDAEALSYFLIKGQFEEELRSPGYSGQLWSQCLGPFGLKPAMTLEEGLWWGMQEWQCQSNFDGMIYKMAANTRPQEGWRWGPACQRPATPNQRHLHTKALTEIPPEAMREYMDIMEGLLRPGGPAEGASGGEWEEDGSKLPQGEEGAYPDPSLLSYIDKLCSQEDFVTKVEAVLHARFLADVLSLEPQLDLLALAEDLEQEDGLSFTQATSQSPISSLLEQKPLLALKQKEGVQAPPSHGTPRLDSRPFESEAGQDTQRHGHGPQLGASDQACPPDAGCGQRQIHSLADAGMPRPKAFAASPGRQESPSLKAGWLHPGPQARWCTSPSMEPRLATVPGETCPARAPLGPTGRPNEDEEELPSLAFLLASQHILPSWGLPQSPTPGSDLLCPGVPQACSPQSPGLSPTGPPAAKDCSRPRVQAQPLLRRHPCQGPASRSLGGQPWLWGLGCPSQSQKRRRDPFVTGKSRKRQCSQ